MMALMYVMNRDGQTNKRVGDGRDGRHLTRLIMMLTRIKDRGCVRMTDQ